jgi:hypothetical protein
LITVEDELDADARESAPLGEFLMVLNEGERDGLA